MAYYEKDAANIAFRFGVGQADKLRACIDLRRNTVSLYCTVWNPIKLPTRNRLSQLRLNFRTSDRQRAFFKEDHLAEYRQLHSAPEHQRLAAIALRDPKTSEWMDFPPNALCFAAAAAVRHYNCFSRLLSALANLIFGIPVA